MSTEMVQKLVRLLKINGGVKHSSSSEEKSYATSYKMEERLGSWRKSARSFYNSRPSRHAAFVFFALFIAFQAFTFVLNDGGGGKKVRSGHSSFTSAPLLNQVNLSSSNGPKNLVDDEKFTKPFEYQSM